MKTKLRFNVFGITASFAINALAAQPMAGEPIGGGIFIHRESVEMYWNDWNSYPLMPRSSIPTSGQARVTIVGEGKTASFIGNLSINCQNGKYFWESAGSFSEFLRSEEQADEAVPRTVIINATNIYCKPRKKSY